LLSIHTNPEAFAGLRNLSAVNTGLAERQQRVSTGLKVRGAVDDASNFAISQGLRGEIRAIDAIIQGLSNSKGIASVAMAGATAVSDMMADIRKKIVEGSNPANTTQQQQILQDDYEQMLAQMRTVLENAVFNGVNILIEVAIPFNLALGSVNDVDTLARLDGGTLRLRGQRVDVLYARLANEDISSPANAMQALQAWEDNLSLINNALGDLGADTRALQFQVENLQAIRDEVSSGLGNIVDADMARESAALTAAQVQQQLSVQTLNIAVSQPRIIQSLFQS
jgi:flagellin